MIEKGADFVICQHSHCVGCEEKYLGGTIVYGQGNFIFDYRNDTEWQTGLLTVIDIEDNNCSKISYVPVQKQGNKVRIAASDEIIDGFIARSEQIKDKNFVVSAFENEVQKNIGWPLSVLLGKFSSSFIYKALNKISIKISKKYLSYKFYNEKNALSVINQINCESHREFLLTGLKQIKTRRK